MVSRSRGGNGPVVVGVSGSAASYAAVLRAADVYGPDRGYVLVRAGRPNEDPAAADEVLEAAADLLPCRSRRQVVLGSPVPGLCETAERLGAVAIVVGARADATGWTQTVLRGLARNATVPVLVVPVGEDIYGAATWPKKGPASDPPPSAASESTSSTATTG